MSSLPAQNGRRRRQVSGVLTLGGRGYYIVTDAGDLWVVERDDLDPDLIGCRVTAEGLQSGYDRLQVEWIGAAAELG